MELQQWQHQGTVVFIVPQDAPDTLYYNSSTQPNMQGSSTLLMPRPAQVLDFGSRPNLE
jgi:hypothetical protein